MKKLILILIVALMLSGCGGTTLYDNPQGNSCDMSAYNIDSDQFYKTDIPEILRLAQQGKTFIVYAGYNECNWCKALVPVLDEVIKEKAIGVYYIDILYEEEVNDYENLQSLIDFCAEQLKYDEQAQNYIIYFPSVISVSKGKVFEIHEGTVSGHNANESALSDKQAARLKYILNKQVNNLLKEK